MTYQYKKGLKGEYYVIIQIRKNSTFIQNEERTYHSSVPLTKDDELYIYNIYIYMI